jgi:circadian clock protein KaiB
VPDVPPVELILFVAAKSPVAVAAIENVRSAFERFPSGTFALQVIDIFEDPERVLSERVLVTPTLLAQPSGRRVVGDLSDPTILDFFLRALAY